MFLNMGYLSDLPKQNSFHIFLLQHSTLRNGRTKYHMTWCTQAFETNKFTIQSFSNDRCSKELFLSISINIIQRNLKLWIGGKLKSFIIQHCFVEYMFLVCNTEHQIGGKSEYSNNAQNEYKYHTIFVLQRTFRQVSRNAQATNWIEVTKKWRTI